jgi:hypothetical protein
VKILLASSVAIVLTLVAMIAWVWIGQVPVIELTATRGASPLTFHLAYKGINSILGISVSAHRDPPEKLWEVRCSFKGNELRYGEIPSPSRGKPIQDFPVDGAAPMQPAPGSELEVTVTYQYDAHLSACMGSRTFPVIVP